MAQHSNRERILTEGLRVVHQKGFAGASVRDIVQAAGVPQGSFTNHFTSKEAFGLEIIELYFANSRAVMRETLLNGARDPLERLEAYLETVKNRMNQNNMRNGCLLGNFTAEACDHSDRIRQRLIEIFAEIQANIASCLRAAVAAGEVAADLDCEEVAGFIVSSVQGANLLAKAQRDPASVERFTRILFSQILRRP